MSAGSVCKAWIIRLRNVRRMLAVRFGCMVVIRYTSRTLKAHSAHDEIALQCNDHVSALARTHKHQPD